MADSEAYFSLRVEQAREEFPELVRVLGYSAALEELEFAMQGELRDMTLFEDQTRLIQLHTVETYWRWVNGNPQIPPNIILGEE